ncbi:MULTISPECIES: MBL fold metallo-hydrolase [unclassified Nocardiopsis]|uniref:MBL fold metallo-hydrolase n=1 Tax=unclassified Nocardiopsis TaxID=2649073 RepID=UPI00135B73AF|nr:MULTISPECIES: MBL fold metallo-hydrolase [unclassified Nocardiopsis]
MFWKRKPKKQDGQEATDSAAEAAEKRDEERAPEEEPETAAAAAGEPAGDAEPEGAGSEDVVDTPEKSDAVAGAESAEEDSGKDDAPADVFADAGEEVGVTGPDDDRITRVRTAGIFEFDGEKSEVVSNTWIVQADDEGVVVIDPAHDADAILKAVGDREVYLVACTNAYSPHIESAIRVAEESEAPIALHPREMRAWRRHHGAEHRPEIEVEGQGALDIGDLHIDVLALPGTSPGTVGYYISELGVVFSGDTLRKGEPGMVGNTYIDYTTQLASIGEALLSLPPDTRILPDRGPATTSGAESKNFDSWV